MSDNLAETKCPTCGRLTLEIVVRVMPEMVPELRCKAQGCTWRVDGWFEDGHAVFPRV